IHRMLYGISILLGISLVMKLLIIGVGVMVLLLGPCMPKCTQIVLERWSWMVDAILFCRLMTGVCDYPLRQSSTANILDYSYASHEEIPRILGDFAEHCIQAARNDTKYCPLAKNSLNTTNPSSDLLVRMNNVIGNLT